MAEIGQEHNFKIYSLTNEYLTSQDKNQHKDMTRQHKDMRSQHNYLTSGVKNIPPCINAFH